MLQKMINKMVHAQLLIHTAITRIPPKCAYSIEEEKMPGMCTYMNIRVTHALIFYASNYMYQQEKQDTNLSTERVT